MNKTILKSVTYEKWEEHYNSCDLKCNKGKYCPFKFGGACIGDILENKDQSSGKTLLQVIEEFVAKREELVKEK